MNFTAANAALRDLLDELIDQRGDTAATLVGWLSGLEVHYPAPAGAAHPLEGHRAPNLMTERGGLHSLLAPRHLLVGLDGRAVDATPTTGPQPHTATALLDAVLSAEVHPPGELNPTVARRT